MEPKSLAPAGAFVCRLTNGNDAVSFTGVDSARFISGAHPCPSPRALSALYDKLGDDIVDELVEWLNQVDLAFRTELHQVNEFAVGRMEAR